MTRRIFLLNGLAILATVCHHAASRGSIAMFWWTDRYRPVTVPNFDQLGTLPYYVLLVISRLTLFAVPTFLFVSGFFTAYAARGNQSVLSWKMVKVRLTNLLVPYLLWSLVIFVGEFLQGITYPPGEYLRRLTLGGADETYFYVPLLCQFYLLSLVVIPIAKTRGKLVLLVSALLQLGAMSPMYLGLLWEGQAPALDVIRSMTPSWLFIGWTFFFAFGVVSSFHLKQLKEWLRRHKWHLLVAVIVLGLMTVIEPEIVYRSTEKELYFGANPLSRCLFSVAVILCFLAFDRISISFSGILHQPGRRSYGIYLLHSQVLEFVARVIRQIAPWILACQSVFQPLLVVMGVGVPLLFMATVSRSGARKFYRYLFG